MEFFEYIGKNADKIVEELLRHLEIIAIAVPIAILIAVPIGIAVSRKPKLAEVVLKIASVLMTIPSLALFGIMVVLLAPVKAGIGIVPAIVAIIVYSMLPMIRNTLVAIKEVDPYIVEAARGMGMTNKQILFKIRLPLGIPIIMAGIRNAVVMGISVTTIAYLIGAGGLGYFIFSGLSRSRMEMILLGAILVGALGILANFSLLKVEDVLTPKGVKINRARN
ncbi:MAG: osmoprotectant transport system permease protein [Kosmotogales bacterium]|nr:osmoprotectant transport system permease protein [Kosmotogales bacterium]